MISSDQRCRRVKKREQQGLCWASRRLDKAAEHRQTRLRSRGLKKDQRLVWARATWVSDDGRKKDHQVLQTRAPHTGVHHIQRLDDSFSHRTLSKLIASTLQPRIPSLLACFSTENPNSRKQVYLYPRRGVADALRTLTSRAIVNT